MLLSRPIWAIACGAALIGAAGDSSAGIVSSFTRDLAGGAAQGAVEKIEPVLARTLADVDSRLTRQEQQIGNVAGGLIGKTSSEVGVRLDQVDGILEKRLLQVQLGVDGVLDHGLDKIDGTARARLAQIDGIAAARIQQVDQAVAGTLDKADEILKNRVADIGQVVTGAIDQADGVLGARIEEIDEVAGRRLGNVDVIATKQRLGLEQTITRSAWLLALVIFVVVALKALWSEYLKSEDAIARAEPGNQRAWLYLTVLGKPLLKHGAVAAVVALLLATVPQRLPMTAAKEQQALVNSHTADLEKSVAALDWTRARFHASQLEFLQPDNAAHYQALAAKAELLRDLLARPTALATTAGAIAMLDRARAVIRLQTGRPDPDAETVQAMAIWQLGNNKKQEHEAASIAARALWSSPRGFTLAPMARILVEAYLHAPLAHDQGPHPVIDSHEGGKSQDDGGNDDDVDLESNKGLEAALDLDVPDPPGDPFGGAETLFHLMKTLDEASADAFIAMVDAQVEVFRLAGDAPAGALAAAKKARNAEAQKVVAAWEDFDRALRDDPILRANPLVLGIFRLDDVALTHALWFTTQPETTAWPRSLASLNAPGDKALKLAIAPARTVWARRYVGLLQGPARGLVEMQEAERFQQLEDQTLAFEASYQAVKIDQAAAAGGSPAGASSVKSAKSDKPDKTKATAKLAARAGTSAPGASTDAIVSPALAALPAAEAHRLQAAGAAAALGLYTAAAGDTPRTPLAITIAGQISDLKKKAEELLAQTKTDSDRALTKGQGDASKKLHDARINAIDSLHALLLGRGTRLI
jgi:hypothetical protein